MASSSQDPRLTQDEDDDAEDKVPLSQALRITQDEDDDAEDRVPLSQVLRIGKQEKPNEEEGEEEETRKDSDDERFKKIKKRPLMRVKDYVKHCRVLKDRMINVGDIVWVNRRWPVWVEKRGHRSATVSFFGSEEKSCKVRLSELYSFEEHFISIPQPITEELSYAIDCALEEFGRRFFLGVMCPCKVSSMEKANDEAFLRDKKKNEFQPTVVLRFVLSRAVSVCVGHEKKLIGAKKGAYVYTFRRYAYVRTDDQKYRQEMRLFESGSSSTGDESEPNMKDNLASKKTSTEMVSEDSYKEKGTFGPPDISEPMIMLLTKNEVIIKKLKEEQERLEEERKEKMRLEKERQEKKRQEKKRH